MKPVPPVTSTRMGSQSTRRIRRPRSVSPACDRPRVYPCAERRRFRAQRKEPPMAAFMKPFESQTYALMRIIVGFLFIFHGTQKLFDFPEGVSDATSNPMMITAGVPRAGRRRLIIAVGFHDPLGRLRMQRPDGRPPTGSPTGPRTSFRSTTAARWRRSTASCSCSSRPRAAGSGASTATRRVRAQGRDRARVGPSRGSPRLRGSTKRGPRGRRRNSTE